MALDLSALPATVVWELFESLNTDPDSVKNAAKADLLRRLDGKAVAPKKDVSDGESKRGRKKDVGDGKTYPSLKEVVRGVLARNPDGLELNGIVTEVKGMISRGEYASNAQSISAVVSQAVNSLKQEQLINHDKESKKYSLATAAA
jgi:hypothetical protein